MSSSVGEIAVQQLAGFLLVVRPFCENSEIEPFELTREWCRTIIEQCGNAPQVPAFKTYWVAETRAMVGNPDAADIDESSLGPIKPSPLNNLLTLHPHQLSRVRSQLPLVESFVSKLLSLAQEKELATSALQVLESMSTAIRDVDMLLGR